MADSVREKILQAIEGILLSVDGIGTVRREKINPLNIPGATAAFIVSGIDDPRQELLQNLNDILDREWNIFLFLWINTEGDLSKTIEAMLASVKFAMVADHTLGGTAHNITEGITHDASPLNEAETQVGILIEYSVRYRTWRADPYTQAP